MEKEGGVTVSGALGLWDGNAQFLGFWNPLALPCLEMTQRTCTFRFVRRDAQKFHKAKDAKRLWLLFSFFFFSQKLKGEISLAGGKMALP